MRSRIERKAAALLMAALLVAALVIGPAAGAAARQRGVSTGTPDAAEIARAIETVKADPNLATERTIKTLRWKSSGPVKRPQLPEWMSWIVGFFVWLGESGRVLVWCAVVLLVGLLAVYLSRIAGARFAAADDDAFVAPTHVRDLDIRPETLPADIGAAARRLWERGDQRAALALLYRGMLSRLAHVHRVPIRDSSTEGDCLALAVARLPADRSEYLVRLVRLWQRLGYGREAVESAAVYALCDEFAAALDPLPAVATEQPLA